ncbi:MAG: hypothetical protein PHZ11_04895 [Desulfitobacteriaceae bacterium]|nr:hypothetical protein [Desulfitobacteriaceae bacterium]MDD4346225.1 hypothetical protein [Desulfitobacteriaceae bacterium]MDD4401642.1 hypothetical protein [Desulfitobacteriaceae bacterium]
MSSLRLEIENMMGLKFPERNGEALVNFEESMEIPRSAEVLMRGLYRDPERVRSAFRNLHMETGSVLDILLPRRSRLREWAEELPERPTEAQAFLRETTEQLAAKEQRLLQIERELVSHLEQSNVEDLFPIPITAFGICSYSNPSVKVFLRPLGKVAEVLQLNPEHLRLVIRIYFLFLLLFISGLDLDGKTYTREADENCQQWISCFYTYTYLQRKSPELVQCYLDWVKAWGGKNPTQTILDNCAEKMRAAMIFWRRQPNKSWEDCWSIADKLEQKRDKYLQSML